MRVCLRFFHRIKQSLNFCINHQFWPLKNLQYQFPRKWTLLVNFVLCLILLTFNWLDTCILKQAGILRVTFLLPLACSITSNHLKLRGMQFTSPNFSCLKVNHKHKLVSLDPQWNLQLAIQNILKEISEILRFSPLVTLSSFLLLFKSQIQTMGF